MVLSGTYYKCNFARVIEMVPLFSILTGTIFGLAMSAPSEYYGSRYDHLDVEMIFNNARMVNYYAACLLNKGPCPPEGVEFRRILPEALETNCLKCTEKQKTVTLRGIRRLKKEYPKIWAQLQAKWDPRDIYVKKFEETYGGIKQSEVLPLSSVETNKIEGGNSISVSTAPPVVKASNNNFIRPISVPTQNIAPKPPTTQKTIITTSQKSTPSSSKFTTTTNKPISTTSFIPIRLPPLPAPNLGASIDATVKMVKLIEKRMRKMARERFKLFNRFFIG